MSTVIRYYSNCLVFKQTYVYTLPYSKRIIVNNDVSENYCLAFFHYFIDF